jgi:glycosyltransferase involved in cell wall biosynthesis
MPSLSLVIVALNEERTIGKVIAAGQELADEIIVVDSGSTDRTIQIAEELKARVVHQDWLGYAAQKNFAMGMAASDWILSLDADEVMTPQLVQEIKSTFGSGSASDYDGFEIPRILYVGETPIKHGGFYPDAQLRLIQRGKGQFNDRLVHEAIKVAGPVKRFRHHMDHFAYADIGQFQDAMEKYARLSAQEFSRHHEKKWRINRLNECLHPGWTFFYRYFLRQGFLDGRTGLELSLIYSDYVRRKIKYLRELVNS